MSNTSAQDLIEPQGTQVPVLAEHIQITPGFCGGKPRIANHRICVQDIVLWHQRSGMSPDEIVSAFPTIKLSDVYAALAYYHDHRAEIDADIKAADMFDAQLKASGPSLLEKIAARNGKSFALRENR
jgi:uncharacterized protein (DUF433 family)